MSDDPSLLLDPGLHGDPHAAAGPYPSGPNSHDGAGETRQGSHIAAATDVAEYIEGLVITQGDFAGRPFELLPYQRTFLEEALAPDVEEAALSVGRGNGKSGLVAAIGCAALNGPLARPRGEVICVASSFTQARILFEDCLAFLRAKIDRYPNQWRVQDSSNIASIEYRPLGARLRALGADPRRLHGARPVLVLLDEPAQQIPSQARAIYGALRTALGKQSGARLIAFGTKSSDPDHYFSGLLNGGADVAHVYSAGDYDAALDVESVRAANPAYDHWPTLARTIDREMDRAALDSTLQTGFRAYRLNVGDAGVGRDLLLDSTTYEAIEVPAAELPDRRGDHILALDLSSGFAMTAACACWPESGRVEILAAFPRVPTLAERGERDSCGEAYERMARDGDLICLGDRIVDVEAFLRACLERWEMPAQVVGDRWRFSELAQAMEAVGIPPALYEPRGQGFRDGQQDVSDFRAAAVSRAVRVPKSFALRHAMASASVVSDPSGNWKISKKHRASPNVRHVGRDDLAVALCMGVAAAARIARAAPLAPSMAGHGAL